MTFYDYITANPWALRLITGLAICAVLLLVSMLIGAYREGRPISLFGIKLGAPPKVPPQEGDAEYAATIQRSRGFLGRLKVRKYTREVARIRSGLPDQAATSLALRSHIHHTLLGITLQVHGGFAGISYPGRKLYLELPTEQLVGMLPEFLDATDQAQLKEKIADFFRITEPNMLGVPIPDDDFQVALQVGIYIVRRLGKIGAWVERRRVQGQPVEYYTEEDLQQA